MRPGPHRGRQWTPAWLATALAVLLTASGCATVVGGRPVSVFDDPYRVAGLPVSSGPSGLRDDAPPPRRDVENGSGDTVDEVAVQAITDIEAFWRGAYDAPLDGDFRQVSKLISWDSGGESVIFCRESTFDLVNAGYCPPDDSIGWDRGQLLPQMRDSFGDMAIVMVLAHEYGHAIQRKGLLTGSATPILVAEQQADCFAGVYMRWVAEDYSPRFTLSTGDGLNNLLAAMISFRDPVPSDGDPNSDEHGSAFERISAFQFGFTDGIAACVAINQAEVDARRGDLPIALQTDQTGELPVSEESVLSMVKALTMVFNPENPPAVSFDSSTVFSCKGARPSPPASYCPDTNTIVVELPYLQELGTKVDDGMGLTFGDNTAYSILTSRFMVGLQRQHAGLVLDNASAALRTACLTGVATTKLSAGVTVDGDDTVALTAGDLDEAVSGMLTNGLAAGDVNGESVPSGFSRIDAFRTGVLGDEQRCYKRFP